MREAIPKDVSGRTSYYPARLEFHHVPQLIRGRFNGRRCGPPQGFAPASSWSWQDRRVSGADTRTESPCSGSLSLRLRVFPLASPVYTDSQAHSSIGTASDLNVLRHLVSTRFQDLFHSPPGVLFTFPSRYLFAIGSRTVFSLGGRSPRLRTGFHVSRLTLSHRLPRIFGYGALTPCGAAFQRLPLTFGSTMCIRAPPLSLATTHGIDLSFFSSGYFDVSVPRVAFPWLCVPHGMTCQWHVGFPHSDVPGSRLTSSSPGLIAGCRVLLRYPAPRHPPRALQTSVPYGTDPKLYRFSQTVSALADKNMSYILCFATDRGYSPLPASISERTMAFSFQGACSDLSPPLPWIRSAETERDDRIGCQNRSWFLFVCQASP